MEDREIFSGQITIFLSLLISIFLALLSTVLYSAIYMGKKAMAESVADVAVNSLFAEYNQKLLEDYDLFYVDMEELGQGLGKEGLAMECENLVNRNIHYDDDLVKIMGYIDLIKLNQAKINCKRYSLASDCDGKIYRQQAVHYMKASYPTTLIRLLKDYTKDLKTDSNRKEARKIRSIKMDHGFSKSDKEEKSGGEKENQDIKFTDKPESYATELMGYVNLIKSGGILKYIWTKPLSYSSIDQVQYVGKRKNKLEGEGFYRNYSYNVAEERLLFNEYLLNHFGNALESNPEHKLQYEIEYIIAGKNEDSKNLKSVTYKLLALRETANYLHIVSDQDKVVQANALALAIASALLNPEAEQLIQQLVIMTWAFGESMLDLKELFAGKRVPVIKDATNFKLSIDHITDIFGQKYESCNSPLAFYYKDYLRLLLFISPKKKLTINSMDLIEANMRMDERYKNFKMDACVEWAEFEMIFSINKDMVLQKSFGYVQ